MTLIALVLAFFNSRSEAPVVRKVFSISVAPDGLTAAVSVLETSKETADKVAIDYDRTISIVKLPDLKTKAVATRGRVTKGEETSKLLFRARNRVINSQTHLLWASVNWSVLSKYDKNSKSIETFCDLIEGEFDEFDLSENGGMALVRGTVYEPLPEDHIEMQIDGETFFVDEKGKFFDGADRERYFFILSPFGTRHRSPLEILIKDDAADKDDADKEIENEFHRLENNIADVLSNDGNVESADMQKYLQAMQKLVEKHPEKHMSRSLPWIFPTDMYLNPLSWKTLFIPKKNETTALADVGLLGAAFSAQYDAETFILGQQSTKIVSNYQWKTKVIDADTSAGPFGMLKVLNGNRLLLNLTTDKVPLRDNVDIMLIVDTNDESLGRLSRDGNWLAKSYDGELSLYQTASLFEKLEPGMLATLDTFQYIISSFDSTLAKTLEFDSKITAMDFLPNGKQLLIGDGDGLVHMVDVFSGEIVKSLQVPGSAKGLSTELVIAVFASWLIAVAFKLSRRFSKSKNEQEKDDEITDVYLDSIEIVDQ